VEAATDSSALVECVWEIGEVPFYIGAHGRPTNAPLPDLLPMRLGVDRVTDALVQIVGPEVREALERAYVLGSQIGTPMSADGFGQPALEDFLAFVLAVRGPLRGARVLEIGCGSGALLHRMGTEGAHAMGVEPDLRSAARARAGGLDVIAEPFAAEGFGGQRFDAIVHYAVLEHVEEPARFLADQLGLLDDGGTIVCSVPDCAPALAHGDLSILVHEHVSYFTQASLHRLAARAGAEVVAIEAARAAGSTYCAMRRATKTHRPQAPVGLPDVPAAEFVASARRCLATIERCLRGAAAGGRTLGIFCPARFINYHALLGSAAGRLRYFDDDPLLHGCYLPPIGVAIESREQLAAEPVDELLVMSWTFGERIAASLRARPELAGTRIVTIDALL
jgi:2-polyprenyl-3-methyl-5-hydroxy-6-metoxy-1,4-benzoquinol methylase